MVKVLFIAEVGDLDENLTLKFRKQIVDLLTDSVLHSGMAKSFAVMVEDEQNHISCGFATDEKMSMMLSTNFGLTYQNQRKNKLLEQQITSPVTVAPVESNWGSDWVDDGV